MLNMENFETQLLITELTPEATANINGGGEKEGGFDYSRYLQALGISYLSPPGFGEITDKEAMLAQYQGWED
ncbi:hypothetical protein WJM97_02255 [Okeanomitos corallinicola TIOX110]|uniref:Uncharacterized protein n=1 Tax=Okeanomitos corallinicola TIOX110 TaxID=3133117 RepID=A0ABZ2UT04_9CYAN